jgi:DNA-binding GntR family transcriptional regulator
VGLASDLAYEALLADILAGTIPPGDRIREEEVAERVGTSRTPVREALRRLHAEGLVELPPHRGAIVQPTMYELDELFEIRALLEGYGAERAAARRTDADLAAMLEVCERMEAVVAAGVDVAELTPLNMAFHRQVQGAAGTARLLGMLPGLMVSPLVREIFRHYTPAELTRSMAQHREVVDALAARDGAWAKSVMCAHLYAGRAALQRLQHDVASGRPLSEHGGVPRSETADVDTVTGEVVYKPSNG